jgi:hypothetical protein
MTPHAAQLLAAAERAEAACDLEIGLPGRAADLARAVTELFGEADLEAASPRALWNLLWLAADLTMHVDVYRAAEILSAVERLFVRHFARALESRGPASEAAEMAFDFFFNRSGQPLEALRFAEVIETLARVLDLPNRFCRRAALHGLGHLRQHHPDGPGRERIESLIDRFVAVNADPTLAEYAASARAGDLI